MGTDPSTNNHLTGSNLIQRGIELLPYIAWVSGCTATLVGLYCLQSTNGLSRPNVVVPAPHPGTFHPLSSLKAEVRLCTVREGPLNSILHAVRALEISVEASQ